MRLILPIALVALSSSCFAGDRQGSADAKRTCAMAAFTAYNQQNLQILQSPANEPIMSVAGIIAKRRLQESYCMQFTTCEFGNSEDPSRDLLFRAAFAECLDSEWAEQNK